MVSPSFTMPEIAKTPARIHCAAQSVRSSVRRLVWLICAPLSNTPVVRGECQVFCRCHSLTRQKPDDGPADAAVSDEPRSLLVDPLLEPLQHREGALVIEGQHPHQQHGGDLLLRV